VQSDEKIRPASASFIPLRDDVTAGEAWAGVSVSIE